MLLATPVLFILYQIKMCAVKKTFSTRVNEGVISDTANVSPAQI